MLLQTDRIDLGTIIATAHLVALGPGPVHCAPYYVERILFSNWLNLSGNIGLQAAPELGPIDLGETAVSVAVGTIKTANLPDIVNIALGFMTQHKDQPDTPYMLTSLCNAMGDKVNIPAAVAHIERCSAASDAALALAEEIRNAATGPRTYERLCKLFQLYNRQLGAHTEETAQVSTTGYCTSNGNAFAANAGGVAI